jgi:hypothetical protein
MDLKFTGGNIGSHCCCYLQKRRKKGQEPETTDTAPIMNDPHSFFSRQTQSNKNLVLMRYTSSTKR